MVFLVCGGLWAGDAAEQATKALETYKATTPPDQVAALFTEFCRTHFGAEKEPLAYAMFGKDLKVMPKGSWTHASVTSACIAWETNLPATTHVEYGKTQAYGQSTAKSERPFYIHVHYLKGLASNTAHHYRLVSVDERGNKVMSEDRTITTQNQGNAIPLPGNLQGPPYKLDKANATYVLMQDFVADDTALEIHASGITLDLNGHTMTYANQTKDRKVFTDKWLSFMHQGSFGIKNIGHSDIKLLNGTILQGQGNNRGNDESTGFNPIYFRKMKNIEIAGVTLDYWTPQIGGIRLRYCEGRMDMHHSVLFDRGNMMHNRHGSGCAVYSPIGCKFENDTIHHCLVKRTRQNGLRPRHKLYNSEIYVDSWATNSFATGVGPGGESCNNRIFCTGYHAISCPWGNGIKVHDNFIHMEGINTGKTRWWEGFGDQNSMNGLRHTQWGQNRTVSVNSEYANNIVVIKGCHGAQIRGVEFFADPYIRNLVLRDSIIKVEARDKETTKAACVVTQGSHGRHAMHLPVTYKNCRFISNVNNLRLGDDYGVGDNHYFINCTFERIGNDPGYDTIRGMGSYNSQHHVLRDCMFKGAGASPDSVKYLTHGARDFRVQYSLTVKAPPKTALVIADKNGKESFKGTVGASGVVIVPLTACCIGNKVAGGKEELTPHTVKVTPPAGAAKTETLTMDKDRTYAVAGAPAPQAPTKAMTVHARQGTAFAVKDETGKAYVEGTMGSVGSIGVILPAGNGASYVISGTHADGETFEEALPLDAALVYTVPHSKKALLALEQREKAKKGKKGRKIARK